MFDWIFKMNNVLQQKGLYLHASSIVISGQAILFLGHSTAGKSTISHLLSEVYSVISDDKVLLIEDNGRWMAQGVIEEFQPGKGKTSKLGEGPFPLLAFMRIYKSTHTHLKPISPQEACKYLLDAIFEIDFQRQVKDITVKKKWFMNAADISRKVKGWGLTFKKDKSTIKLICSFFENGCVRRRKQRNEI